MNPSFSAEELALLAKYHERLKADCASQRAFRKKVTVNRHHIYMESINKMQTVRRHIQDSHLAALLIRGELNSANSNLKRRRSALGKESLIPEIAVEAIFKDFEWEDPPGTHNKKNLAIRAVAKPEGNGHFIVTLYVDDGTMNTSNLREISYEIWD